MNEQALDSIAFHKQCRLEIVSSHLRTVFVVNESIDAKALFNNVGSCRCTENFQSQFREDCARFDFLYFLIINLIK